MEFLKIAIQLAMAIKESPIRKFYVKLARKNCGAPATIIDANINLF